MRHMPIHLSAVLALLGINSLTTAAAEPQTKGTPWLVSEANLPQGYPAAGPVDEVVVKTYPVHRLARVRSEGGTDGMFWKLFNHIKRNDIAMTAPVEMSWGNDTAVQPGDKPVGEPKAMAFLYREPTLGNAGADPNDAAVMVEDVPEVKVVSIGLRGSYGKKTFLRGYEKLTAWLAEHPEWQASGSPRTLGYNSPMVPGFMKFSEVQIPIVPSE